MHCFVLVRNEQQHIKKIRPRIVNILFDLPKSLRRSIWSGDKIYIYFSVYCNRIKSTAHVVKALSYYFFLIAL